jgi:hypothetical protein
VRNIKNQSLENRGITMKTSVHNIRGNCMEAYKSTSQPLLKFRVSGSLKFRFSIVPQSGLRQSLLNLENQSFMLFTLRFNLRSSACRTRLKNITPGYYIIYSASLMELGALSCGERITKYMCLFFVPPVWHAFLKHS